jgi:hypothetical protein
MAGPLTWRDVAAPDFRTSMEGFQQFAQMLGNATNGLDRTVNRIDGEISQRVNNDILANILPIQDPNALQGAITSQLANIDRARLAPETLKVLGTRATELLNQQHQGLQNEQLTGDIAWTSGRRDRQTGQEAKLDAVTPRVNEYLALAQSGNAEGAQAYIAKPENADIRGLTVDQFNNILESARQGLSGDVNYDSGRQGLSQSATRFSNEQTEWRENREADALYGNLLQQGVEPGDIDRHISANFDELVAKYGAPVVMAARRRALGDPMLQGGGSSPIPGGGGANNDPTRIMNYEAQAAGFASVPDDVKTLGQASDFALKVNAAGAESSAMGTYQIVGQTMRNYAPRVFGAGWRNVNFDQAAQEKIAEAIFNDHKGSAAALSKQWVSLSPAEAEQVRKMPWSQARQIIASKESGASAAFFQSLQAQGTGAVVDIANNQQGNPGSRFADHVLKNYSNARSAIEVARDVTGEGKPLAGEDTDYITGELQRIARKYNTNPTVAAIILQEARSGARPWYDLGDSPLNPWGSGLKAKYDPKLVDALGKRVQNYEGLRTDALSNEGQRQASGGVQQARAALQAAQQRLAAKRTALINSRKPITENTLGAEYLAVQAAQGAYEIAVRGGQEAAIGGNRLPPPDQTQYGSFGRRGSGDMLRRPAGPAKPVAKSNNRATAVIAGALTPASTVPSWLIKRGSGDRLKK